MNDELKTLMVFGGAAALLSKARKPKTSPAVSAPAPAPASPENLFAHDTSESVEGTFSLSSNGWEDSNYAGGFIVGAASVAVAWYAWTVFRPKLRRVSTPESY